ncbi:MAG TPA: hypothetical protein VF065_07615, partial [Ilumatobacter sp.]
MALIAAGVLAVAQLASDEATPVVNAAQETGTTPPTPAPETTAPAPTTVATDDEAPADVQPDDIPDLDGEIVIQIGDGDPIVIDLGDLGSLGDLAGGDGDLGDLGKIEECIGGLAFDLDIDAAPGELSLPGLPGLFGDGDDLTVAGPDGLSVLDFGDGDGSVTITKEDGEITITSDGDVQVQDLDDLFGSLPDGPPTPPSLPALPDFDQIYQCLED